MEAAQRRALAEQRRLHGAHQTANLDLTRAQEMLHRESLALDKVQVGWHAAWRACVHGGRSSCLWSICRANAWSLWQRWSA